ncbi:MAG: hypothetical protein A3A31_01620 [Candidatus Zambryskibacteria bacterium RIFCSPLOWO2_01_FULL_48_25]|nr:MAG: hypothetical protein A3A31_01620 [Candidatus Zambryskibacteria bacterium RIFCSPLOWO2_01_FULL_48_25]
MEKQTKKMAATQVEIDAKKAEHDEVLLCIDQVAKFKPQSAPSKQKQDEILSQLQNKCGTIGKNFDELRTRLELETLDMLAGADTDFVEETPADALRNAS